jgi:hypothetical protein
MLCKQAAGTPVHLAMAEELDGVTGRFYVDKIEQECPWKDLNRCNELIDALDKFDA